MTNKTLINLSNHPSARWSESQKQGWDKIIDIPFPQVSSTATTEDIQVLATEIFKNFVKENYRGAAKSPLASRDVLFRFLKDYAFHVAGEFTLFYYLVELLKTYRSEVVIATTERRTIEKVKEDGTVEKTTVFEFVRWRSI